MTIKDFLSRQGCTDECALVQDGSARSYMRVRYQGRNALVMDMSRVDNGADELLRFIRIADWLRGIGLSTPEIYAHEGDFALIEDFGDEHFVDDPNYDLALQALQALQTIQSAEPLSGLARFHDGLVYTGRLFLLDYYMPATMGVACTDGGVARYNAMWDEIEGTLPPPKMGAVHGDYHVENLMWLRDRDGVKRCGIIDFQDMMIGPIAYDLCNLAWDMRTDVDDATRAKILQSVDGDTRDWAYVLAAQFHCRLVGQCVRWALNGKPQYLKFLPRIYGYLAALQEEPILAPLKSYFAEIELDFNSPADVDLVRAKQLLRADAF